MPSLNRRLIPLSIILLLLSGCAGTSTFKAYPKQINPYIKQLNEDKGPKDALANLDRYRTKQDKILYLWERARIAQINDDINTSKIDYADAITAVRAQRETATISASSIGVQGAALLVNDNAIPYKGEGYEKVFMYHFQGMNYLMAGNIEGAGVEVRRANLEQNQALRDHAKEVEVARKEASNKRLSTSSADAEVARAYSLMDPIVGSVKNSFQNAYTFYFSGIVYELLKQPNDAYIDYKKAIEIYPDNPYVQQDVLRLAQRLGFHDEYTSFKIRFGAYAPPPPEHSSELVIFYEAGFVPQKQQIKIPLPIQGRLTPIAFPVYSGTVRQTGPLQVQEAGNVIGRSAQIVDVQALAAKALQEDRSVLVIRQILRTLTKAGVFEPNSRERTGVNILASIYNVVSENADLRSWLTLPAQAHIVRLSLAPGEHLLNLQDTRTGGRTLVTVMLPPNSMTLLRVVGAGSTLYTQSIEFSTS